MAGNIKATRLGDILLEKGLLREDQLQLAIAEQKRRRATLDPSDKRMMDATSIGEILIEMGYITRQQLKRGLNWQMYLRKMTLVMSLVAPLMSAAGGAVAQTTTPTTNSTNSSNTTTTSLMIQAEDFSAMKGIKVEATIDEGGGSNVGAIDAGDWLAYANQEINIAAATTFKVTYRVSSLYGGGSFSLHELDTGVEYDRVDVPKTGNFQKWVDVERTVTLPAGRHTLGLTALVKGFNINWFKLEPIVSNPPQSATVSSASSSQPSSVAVSSSSQPGSTPVVVSSSSQPSSTAVSSVPASSTPAVTSSSKASSVAVSSSSQPSSVAVSSSSPASSAPVSSASSSLAATGNTPTLSLRIEAEHYSAMGGVKVETTKDEGGGSNIGSIDASDWLAYRNHEIYAPTASNYKVSYRVSSLYGGGSFYLYDLDTGLQFGQVDVPKTGNFQKWITVEQTITLPAGSHKLGITAITKGFNINWIQLDYKGVALPVKIQAEDYAAMKGIKVEVTKDVDGGSNIGSIDAGDWMSYENTVIDIPTTGNYKITYRTASLYGGGSFAFHEADGSKQYDVVEVPKTGNFQKWVDVERIVTLEAGPHIFGMTALAKGYNINWFKIEEAPAGSAPSNATASSSSSTAVVASSSSSSSAATTVPPQTTSSAPVVSSASSSSAAAVTSSAASSVASSAAGEGTSVAGPVYLRWNIPHLREDGAALDTTELGGYEVRYRRAADTEYTYVSIEDAYKNELNLSWLEGTYVFEVAAFDKNGLYSRFIKINPN
ncbi:hypothetical protein CBP51_11885 [Cellvibrio mixtus]|uniref:CBM6 domain-containing protein n=1 Tax=Cellvibrio mixtus TaxID=39650 RepID=A0A266QCK4_9GAMM|nr:carbohydrate-binding protein [Cellvibrio mixtus]OZY87634.1 hypothetical protein CBP51_11885 [Cellvibrio mixtus]